MYSQKWIVLPLWVARLNIRLLQVSIIREGLAEMYENEEQWSKAAQMLSGIDLESGQRYDFDCSVSFTSVGNLERCE